MKKLFIITLIFGVAFSFGGTKGSKKLFATHTAKTLKSGEFALTSGMNFFTKAFDQSAGTGVDAFNFWQINGDVSLSYGIMDGLDLSLSSRLYQDTQQDKNNTPAYIDIAAKYGNIEISGRSFLMAANLGITIGTAEYENILFEDYTSSGSRSFLKLYSLTILMNTYLKEQLVFTHL